MSIFKKNNSSEQGGAKKNVKAKFKNNSFKMGGYSLLLTAIVIAVVIVLNIVVGALPSKIRSIDTTSEALFSISQQTEEQVKALDTPVTLNYVVESGNEQDIIEGLLEKYSELSGKITVKKVDPAVDPSFASKYTDGELNSNSVVVESEKRYKVVDISDIIVESTDFSTYSTTGQATTTYSFAGEGAITGAIDFVVSDDLPVAYTLTGHGESEFTDTVKGYISTDNVIIEDLSLISESSVPEDAAALIINAPASDISAEEEKLIADYMEKGGRLLLLTNYAYDETGKSFKSFENLEKITKTYGCSLDKGVIMEGDSSHYYQSQYYLLPVLNSHEITAPLIDNGSNIITTATQGITVSDKIRSSVSVTKLLTTTESAYEKTDLSTQTLDKEKGDIDGPFNVAVAAEEDYNGVNSRMVWISCANMLEDEVDSVVSGGNSDLFRNSLSWLTGREDSISIRAKSLSAQALTVDSSSAYAIMIITIIVIPMLIIAAGLVIWIRRRKR